MGAATMPAQLNALSASTVVERHLEKPIDEISAIASLLGMARRLPDEQRFGYDLDFLHEIMLRRIRLLAAACQEAVGVIVNDDCDPESVAELPRLPHFED